MDEEIPIGSRFLSETRLNETMFREMISWIGLFTSHQETLKHISKPRSKKDK
jgi:hypothetical protein